MDFSLGQTAAVPATQPEAGTCSPPSLFAFYLGLLGASLAVLVLLWIRLTLRFGGEASVNGGDTAMCKNGENPPNSHEMGVLEGLRGRRWNGGGEGGLSVFTAHLFNTV